MPKKELQLSLPFGSDEAARGDPPKVEWDDRGAHHKHRLFHPMPDLALRRLLRLREKFGDNLVVVQEDFEQLQRRRPPANDVTVNPTPTPSSEQ